MVVAGDCGRERERDESRVEGERERERERRETLARERESHATMACLGGRLRRYTLPNDFEGFSLVSHLRAMR
jgi:hypothetical protein